MTNHYPLSPTKRLFDLGLGIALLTVLLFPFVIISLLILITSGRPIFFSQKRSGLGRKPFSILKFRTMYVGADGDQSKYKAQNISPPPTFKLKDDPRHVGAGKWLAKTGLDEIPQLINIIKAEMSIVGPRPFPVSEDEKLPPSWHFRRRIRPGILSSWSISNREKISLRKWVSLDRDDIQKDSLIYDTSLVIRASLWVLKQVTKIS